jgi:hypothetical protein
LRPLRKFFAIFAIEDFERKNRKVREDFRLPSLLVNDTLESQLLEPLVSFSNCGIITEAPWQTKQNMSG